MYMHNATALYPFINTRDDSIKGQQHHADKNGWNCSCNSIDTYTGTTFFSCTIWVANNCGCKQIITTTKCNLSSESNNYNGQTLEWEYNSASLKYSKHAAHIPTHIHVQTGIRFNVACIISLCTTTAFHITWELASY